MPFTSTAKVKIFYEVKGEGDTLVLLHDLFQDHHIFDSWVVELSKSYQVIAVDLRGCGQSELGKDLFTIKEMAQDVKALLKELKIEKFSLLGNSMGAAVALAVAREHQDGCEKLILGNGFIHLSEIVKWSLEIIEEMFSHKVSLKEVYKLYMPWILSSRFFDNPEDIKAIIKVIEKSKHPIKAKSFKFLVQALMKFNATSWIKKIKTDSLVVIGEEDIFTIFKESRSLVRALENSQVELFPGGHSSFQEGPNRFKEIAENFLKTKVED